MNELDAIRKMAEQIEAQNAIRDAQFTLDYVTVRREQVQEANDRVTQLEKELASETRWARHYFDRWQDAEADADRMAAELRVIFYQLDSATMPETYRRLAALLERHDQRKAVGT